MKQLFHKYQSYIYYMLFGGVTTVINFGVYSFCTRFLGWNVVDSNIPAFIISVFFAFVTNKQFVFRNKSESKVHATKQLVRFFTIRVATLIIDTVILYVFVTNFGINDLLVKVVSNFIVVVLNYIFSRFVVFK